MYQLQIIIRHHQDLLSFANSLILDGCVIKENLKQINKDEAWLDSILKSHEIKKQKSYYFCILDEYDKILIQKKK
ncbi:MAG: YetF domain-containing protein [Clostridioides difficile]